jgi:MscS family membrane protein
MGEFLTLIESVREYTLSGYYLFDLSLALIVILVTFIARPFLAKKIIDLALGVSQKTKSTLDDKLLFALLEPLRFMLTILGWFLAYKLTLLHSESSLTISRLFSTLFYAGFSWMLFVFVDVLAKAVSKKLGEAKKMRLEMANFIIKFLKTVVVIVSAIVIFQLWGYNVSAMLASLGLGGLAFALAAKDTAANLFGSLVILWDKPFEHGDWIVSGDDEGTVIEIGMRSTTVRTFGNALITIPNAKIANTSIVNWSKRAVGRRIKMHIGVTYDATPEQLRQSVKEIKAMLLSHPNIAKDRVISESEALIAKHDSEGIKDTLIVNVDNFGESSINILIYCFSDTVNWLEWLDIKEDVMFNIMDIIKANGMDFAFPSQTIYYKKDSANLHITED